LEYALCTRYKKAGLASNSNHCILKLRQREINAQDEEDFVFACLPGAYIQSLCQQEEGQYQFQRGKARVQQKADEKSKMSVGARMVIGRHKAADWPLLNINLA